MIKKCIAYSLILLFALVSFSHATYMLDRIVATVNQEVITWSDLYRAMQAESSPAIKALPEEERNKLFKDNEAAFLENLISFRLQVQAATENKFRVSDDEVDETIAGIKKKYSMSDAQFENSLMSEGYTLAEYKKKLKDQILQSKIVNQQVRTKVLVTEADVDKFMKENSNALAGNEAYHIRQIFFKKPHDEAEKSAVEEKAQAVYAQALQGADFAELARKNSEDAGKATGGDLGFIEKGNLGREFSAALVSMKQGDISKPFWSNAGMHILKLEEMASPKSGTELREAATAALQNKMFNEKYKAWTKSLREKAFIDIRL